MFFVELIIFLKTKKIDKYYMLVLGLNFQMMVGTSLDQL